MFYKNAVPLISCSNHSSETPFLLQYSSEVFLNQRYKSVLKYLFFLFVSFLNNCAGVSSFHITVCHPF